MFFPRFSFWWPLFLTLVGAVAGLRAQEPAPAYWHKIEREIHYLPDGHTFVGTNGTRRFNRALYGGPSGFRVETGDLPEFAMYRPRLAGTLRFGLLSAGGGKWLIDAARVRAIYDPGMMRYVVRDPLLDQDSVELEVLALHESDGMIFRFRTSGAPFGLRWLLVFGGASDERFSREGDIGADPESVFYLSADHTVGNEISVDGNTFSLTYARGAGAQEMGKELRGAFPPGSELAIADAGRQDNPQILSESSAGDQPVLTASVTPSRHWQYGVIRMGSEDPVSPGDLLPHLFAQADSARRVLAGRVKVTTPDPFINTLGGALAVAADGVWEAPAYHHGAIAWRQQLVGWRGAYIADPLGWHDRGRTHFRAYAKSQLTEPPSGPVTPDTSRNFARQVEEIGTAVFTEGYISRYPGGERLRAHHYDMNQVYIDALLRHFDWTGDRGMARELWPVIERHLAWEKRNFDADGDALYDAYCSIWASDAVQYSGGGVTHASSYHYYSNRRAAELATLLGKDPAPYRAEAERIAAAVNAELWMPREGMYAEFKDLLGGQMLHRSAAIWTVYHAIDSELPDPFQAFQMTEYVDRDIPHIPVRARGLADSSLYTISTSDWLPYTWSVNNVALAEVMHTSLAFWQAGRPEAAYRLWKSALVESMYLGASPGSFQQLSFYDAIRGELYRDFADPIAMVTRSLVEGLYGIRPDLLNRRLRIAPGFPGEWERAAIELPDVDMSFRSNGSSDIYRMSNRFPDLDSVDLRLNARKLVTEVLVNGQRLAWNTNPRAIGKPVVQVTVPVADTLEIEIRYERETWGGLAYREELITGTAYTWPQTGLEIVDLYDPQKVWKSVSTTGDRVEGTIGHRPGKHTFFVAVRQGGTQWWIPAGVNVRPPIAVDKAADGWTIRNLSSTDRNVGVSNRSVAGQAPVELTLAPGERRPLSSDAAAPVYGTTRILAAVGNRTDTLEHIDWTVPYYAAAREDYVDLSTQRNAAVTEIFTQQYFSPRPSSPTVQLPTTGIGNWCYPTVEASIDDSGLRAALDAEGRFRMPSGLAFQLPSPDERNNIAFTSRWDVYPDSLTVALSGRATHAYFLLAGSTNPMQSQLDNGVVEIRYTDGSTDRRVLRNPDSWMPIEQDYYIDGYAFRTDDPRPPRVHLKTGEVPTDFTDYTSIRGFTDFAIDGGAANVLDLPLDPTKELQSLTLRTLANDVVIGLMAATLIRP